MKQPTEHKLFAKCCPTVIQMKIFSYVPMVKQVKPKMQLSLKNAL